MEKEFLELYSEINEISPEEAKRIAQIQCEQDTKYSRIKTCYELWKRTKED